MNLFESIVSKIANKIGFVGNFLGLLERLVAHAKLCRKFLLESFEVYWKHLSIAPKFP
jgi:hypothetical protein